MLVNAFFCLRSLLFFLLLCVGKVWKPKDEEKVHQSAEDEAIETEWDEVLQQATEEELVDLAGD